MPRCVRCDRRRKLDQDGYCKACRTELSDFFAGASCARCDLDLSFDGYCPNDHCPFADTYQDELTGNWLPPDDDERLYIETVVRPRLQDR
jgi:hypothetical protein